MPDPATEQTAEPDYNLRGVQEAPPEGLTRANLAKGLLVVFAGTVFMGMLIFAFSHYLKLQTDNVINLIRDILTVETPIVTISIAFYLGSDAHYRNKGI